MNCLAFLSRLLLFCAVCCSTSLHAEERLSLDRALELALANSNLVKIARAKIHEKGSLAAKMESNLFPRLVVGGFGAYNTNPIDDRIHAGDLDYLLSGYGGATGPLGFLSPFPSGDIPLAQGAQWPYVVHATVIQPLSMLPKIMTGAESASLEQAVAMDEFAALADRISYDVTRCYCSIIATEYKMDAARAEITYIRSRLAHATDAVEVGERLEITIAGLQVELTRAELALEKTVATRKRLAFLLNMLTGRDLEERVAVERKLPRESRRRSRDEYLQAARKNNPELARAGHQLHLADHAMRLVEQGNYPDVFAFGTLIHQEGMPLVEEDFGLFGVGVSWDLYDFGETEADRQVSRQKKIQAREMQEKVARELEKNVLTSFSELQSADTMIRLAEKECDYRQKDLELARDQVQMHQELETRELKARSGLAKAESDLVAARINRLLILCKLEQLAGLSAGTADLRNTGGGNGNVQ